MYSHITRSETQSLFSTRYVLTAQIHPLPDELHIINHSRLGRMEVFHDPLREEHAATAAAAHDRARARGLFPSKVRDVATIAGAELRTIVATVRALRAFKLTVADMLRPGGITIHHKSLQAITEIERAIVECIDTVDRFVTAARNYATTSEDIFAPGADQDQTVPPTQWTRTWTR